MKKAATMFLALAALFVRGAFAAETAQCEAGNAGLNLPPGFCATVFADHLGHARHLAVAEDGTVYVNTWSGDYYTYGHVDRLPAGGFLVALRDTRGTGHADFIKRFGDGVAQGSAGGTGVALYHNALYAEMNDRIVKYALPAGAVVPSGSPQTVVSGLPLGGDHPMHPFVIDSWRNLALRRQQARSEILSGGALRHRHPQRRGDGFRCSGTALRHPTWPRSAARELSEALR